MPLLLPFLVLVEAMRYLASDQFFPAFPDLWIISLLDFLGDYHEPSGSSISLLHYSVIMC